MIDRLNAALEGRYQIVEQIGEGGMATVYLAEDIKHNRKVALKVLKPELAAVVGADRFLDEIETTANLQHPHILPLYDSGEADSFLYYVMPYVEGTTLADRLEAERQLAVDEAVSIATAVANALDFAHRKGVVHRDIKPGNILFQDGEPVVSDFGIALAVGAGSGTRLTETGLSLGTPYYMSPEQATGDQQVGAGSDIYSLGCVLYEMLVGDPPYMGSTAQAVLGQIITGKPVETIQRRSSVPAHVDAAIRKALERIPADRFSTAVELAAALGNPAFRHGEAAGAAARAGSARRWKTATGVAVLAAGLGLGWGLTRGAPEALPAYRAIRLEPPTDLERWSFVTFPPDGSFMVHHLSGDPTSPEDEGAEQTTALWVQRWDGQPPTLIPGTEGAGVPAVSPDGSRVAFVDEDGALAVTYLDGSGEVILHPSIGFTYISWESDGFIYGSFSTTRRPVIQRVPESGGEAENVTAPVPGRSHRYPTLLPGRRGLLYTSDLNAMTQEADSIGVLDLESGQQRILTAGFLPWYSPSGHLVFLREGQIMAAPMELETLELTAPPVAIAGAVIGFQGASLSGDLVTLEGRRGGTGPEVAFVHRDGSESTVEGIFEIGAPSPEDPALSPDGSRLALVLQEEEEDVVYVFNLEDGVRTRLAHGARPTWSGDGQYVGFTLVDSIDSAWRVRADGSAPPERLTADHLNVDFQVGRWSLEGPLVVGTSTGLAVVEPGDSLARPLLEGDAAYNDPALSPDGRWVAYHTRVDGELRAFVRPYPDVGSALYPVSVGLGEDVQWSRDGKTLYYVGESEEGIDVFAAEIRTEPDFEVVFRHPVFPLQRGYQWSAGGWYYAVEEGGEGAVMVRKASEASESTGVVLMQNFDALLKELVGG